MSIDIEDLRKKAEAALDEQPNTYRLENWAMECGDILRDYFAAASPAVVLELLRERDKLSELINVVGAFKLEQALAIAQGALTNAQRATEKWSERYCEAEACPFVNGLARGALFRIDAILKERKP